MATPEKQLKTYEARLLVKAFLRAQTDNAVYRVRGALGGGIEVAYLKLAKQTYSWGTR